MNNNNNKTAAARSKHCECAGNSRVAIRSTDGEGKVCEQCPWGRAGQGLRGKGKGMERVGNVSPTIPTALLLLDPSPSHHESCVDEWRCAGEVGGREGFESTARERTRCTRERTRCTREREGLAMREEEGVPCAFTRISLLPSVAMIDVGLVLRRVPLQVRSC